MANGRIFYTTKSFLCNATKEFHGRPETLKDLKFYSSVFKLFRYRIQQKRECMITSLKTYESLKKTKDFEPFQKLPVLSNILWVDKTVINQSFDEDKTLIECASLKCAEGGYEVYIICADPEYENLVKLSNGYPVAIVKCEKAIELLDEHINN